jgi:hypothetical protein
VNDDLRKELDTLRRLLVGISRVVDRIEDHYRQEMPTSDLKLVCEGLLPTEFIRDHDGTLIKVA